MSYSVLGCVAVAGCLGGLVLGSLSTFTPGGAAPILILLGALSMGVSVATTYRLRTRLQESA